MIGFLFRALLVFFLNALALWAIHTYLFPDTFIIEGGLYGYFYVGVIFTILNIILKPVLYIITLPFRLFTGALASLIANTAILYILQQSVNLVNIWETSIIITGIFVYIAVGALMALANAVFHAIGIE